MTPVTAAGDLVPGDQVDVRAHHVYGYAPAPQRGSVLRVGKVAAVIRLDDGTEKSVRFLQRVTAERGGRFPGKYKADFHPITKLSARDIWLEACPSTVRVWGGEGQAPTIIVRKESIRQDIDLVIQDLHGYREWLRREPKEDGHG